MDKPNSISSPRWRLLAIALVGLLLVGAVMSVWRASRQRTAPGPGASPGDVLAYDLSLRARELPSRMPVLPFRNGAPMPGERFEIRAGRAGSVAALRAAARTDRALVVLTQRHPKDDTPRPADLFQVGTAVLLDSSLEWSGAEHFVWVRGIARVRVESIDVEGPGMVAEVALAVDDPVDEAELGDALTKLRSTASGMNAGRHFVSLPMVTIIGTRDPCLFMDLLAASQWEDRQAILEAFDPAERLSLLVDRVAREAR